MKDEMTKSSPGNGRGNFLLFNVALAPIEFVQNGIRRYKFDFGLTPCVKARQ